MSLSSTDGLSQFTFEFQRFNIDRLFSTDDRNRLKKWIDEARLLLIDILRRDHIQIIYMWYNIYHGVYDQLTPSVTTSRCLELLGASPTDHQDIDVYTTLSTQDDSS
ncbi:unnamed protein product [Adineta steineri]|uniref:Uncharacterized protein n=1 Tax=Adineta steineri TaxID=433720 RepID=A0A814FJY7_9BILA|nr:unnamed protein product [Adineta steineri]CAF3800925.1 unnamed protein product [Adineta steineri]